MAIVVLVLWIVTAGAGVYLLVTSGLGQARSARLAAPGQLISGRRAHRSGSDDPDAGLGSGSSHLGRS